MGLEMIKIIESRTGEDMEEKINGFLENCYIDGFDIIDIQYHKFPELYPLYAFIRYHNTFRQSQIETLPEERPI